MPRHDDTSAETGFDLRSASASLVRARSSRESLKRLREERLELKASISGCNRQLRAGLPVLAASTSGVLKEHAAAELAARYAATLAALETRIDAEEEKLELEENQSRGLPDYLLRAAE